MATGKTIMVKEIPVTVIEVNRQDYISLTDMLKAKDGEFFISDWLRNRNTLEFLGIWESIYNPAFNYGEFATIKSQAGLNSFFAAVGKPPSSHSCRRLGSRPAALNIFQPRFR